MGIPKGITKEAVLAAARQIDEHGPAPYGPSKDWDAIINGKRYPPKALVGIAAKNLFRMTPEQLGKFGGEGAGRANECLRDLHIRVEDRKSVTHS